MRSILLGLLLCACVSRSDGQPVDDLGEPFGPSVTLDVVSPDRVAVTYEVATPVRALQFRRVPDGQRAEGWELTDPAFRLLHDAEMRTDRIVRADGAPFTTIGATVPATYTNFPKDYAPFMPYRNGGLLIHSGRFQVCPEACGAPGEPDSVDAFPMAVRFPATERAIIEGEIVTGGEASWIDRADGTMVYVGRTEPVASEHVVGVIDPDLPLAFRTQLDDLFPRLMAYYAERLGALDATPMLFVALDRNAAVDGNPDSRASRRRAGPCPTRSSCISPATAGWKTRRAGRKTSRASCLGSSLMRPAISIRGQRSASRRRPTFGSMRAVQMPLP